jgi:LuxR family transcriptional regulator, quorum-sensing system regulator SolR
MEGTMGHWVASLLSALDRANSAEEVFAAICEGARTLGFEWCAYGAHRPVPFTRMNCYQISNYAESWRMRYAEARYLQVDPTVKRAKRSITPMVWNDQDLRGATQFWDEASSFGLRYGWAQSCIEPGGVVGLLSLARAHEPLADAEVKLKDPELRWLANVAHVEISRHLEKLAPAAIPRLTPREVEVMRWAADGKSARQTAQILGVKKCTVDLHVANVRRKLGANSRPAAAAQAAAMGLLR